MSQNIEKQLEEKGVSLDEFDRQLACFINGLDPIDLKKACTPNNGIVILSEGEKESFHDVYENQRERINSMKFVPASGAASRMFKHLFQFKQVEHQSLIEEFLKGIHSMPFKNLLISGLEKQGWDAEKVLSSQDIEKISTVLLNDLEFGNLPKGMIPFHKTEGKAKTAFQEHVEESLEYLNPNATRIHFTVPFKDQALVRNHLQNYAEKHSSIELSYSVQLPKTDTICVDENNNPVVSDEGNLVFRPGGHGALIHNLNSLEADLIFIKNIDNIVPKINNESSVYHKKVLAGFALHVKKEIDRILTDLEEGKSVNVIDHKPLFKWLGINLEDTIKLDTVQQLLQRPLRICGMVKNEGEPGGGPFWVQNKEGRLTSQIVEKSQVNLNKNDQAEILKSSSHFNPVDLICLTKDHHGKKFDLFEYTDLDTSFIASKTLGDKKIKALEHPGLWNGAMAEWNTIFVEVPLSTFNPVKTVNDLLKPMHQK